MNPKGRNKKSEKGQAPEINSGQAPEINSGQALLIVTAFLGIALVFGFITVSNTMQFNKVVNIINGRAVAKEAAGAGLAKALWCLNQSSGENCGGTFGSSYAGESDVFVVNASFTTTINDKDSNTKTITSTGFYPSATSTQLKVVIKQDVGIDTDVINFHFGAQVDEGGLIMENGSKVKYGNVYSNGNISGNGTIEGDAYVAAGTAPTADQQHASWDSDFIFGKSSDPNKYDIAQSFKPSITEKLNKVSFYIKKTGNPANANVKIVTNDNGKPSKTVLASGILNASKVTSSYYWIEVSMFSPPQLSAGTTYWVIFDASGSASNYWSIKFDDSDSYPDGTGKYSPNWSASHPDWYSAGGDFNFKTYMGGVTTSLAGVHVYGNARANTINGAHIDGSSFSKLVTYAWVDGSVSSDEMNWVTAGGSASSTYIFYSTIGGNAYCQTIAGSLVGGVTYCPAAVTPPDDPAPIDMPISDGQIDEWKQEAADGGVIYGNYSPPGGTAVEIGPKKITGDLLLENNQQLILTGGLYVEGNLRIDNGASIILDSSYGQNSGFIIMDGTIHTKNNGTIGGSGQENSTLLLASLASGGGDHDSAIDLHNRAEGAVFYAPNGLVYLHNNVYVTELTAYKIHLDQNAELRYDTGLIETNFTSGPGGAWILKKGTWRIIK